MTTYTATVLEDPEDPNEYILQFPDEVIAEAGWNIGDTLVWADNGDGTWSLTKKE